LLANKAVDEASPGGKEAVMLDSYRVAVEAARRDGQLYVASLLPEERILGAFGAARSRKRFPPSRHLFRVG
jgi:hypothetical protein